MAIACGWIFVPFIAACIISCCVLCFIPKLNNEEHEKKKATCVLLLFFFLSVGGMGYVYYLLYKYSWYLVFINVGLTLPFICCYVSLLLKSKSVATKEDLEREAREVR